MARKFAKINPNIWNSPKLRPLNSNAKLLGIYFMTNEYFQMIGIYRLPKYFMTKDLGLSDKQLTESLDELIAAGFCRYDYEAEVIWVVGMALSQVADKPNEKQLKGVHNELTRLLENELPFVAEFFELYGKQFNIPPLDELYYDTTIQ